MNSSLYFISDDSYSIGKIDLNKEKIVSQRIFDFMIHDFSFSHDNKYESNSYTNSEFDCVYINGKNIIMHYDMKN